MFLKTSPMTSSWDYEAWQAINLQRLVSSPFPQVPPDGKGDSAGSPRAGPGHGGAARSEDWTEEGERRKGEGEKKEQVRRGVSLGQHQRPAGPPPLWICGWSCAAERREARSDRHYLRLRNRGGPWASKSSSQPRLPPSGAQVWPQPQPLCAQPRHAIFPTSAPPWPDLANPCLKPLPGRMKNHRAPRSSLQRPRAAEPRPDRLEGPGTRRRAADFPNR